MHDGRQLAHRVDGQKFRGLVLALLEVRQFDPIGSAGLLQHPVHHAPARLRPMIENDFIHAGPRMNLDVFSIYMIYNKIIWWDGWDSNPGPKP